MTLAPALSQREREKPERVSGYLSRMDIQEIRCPYCGEPLEVFVDRSVRRQEYIEDCQVCCRPITLIVTLDRDDDRDAHVEARSEDA